LQSLGKFQVLRFADKPQLFPSGVERNVRDGSILSSAVGENDLHHGLGTFSNAPVSNSSDELALLDLFSDSAMDSISRNAAEYMRCHFGFFRLRYIEA